MGKSQLLVGTCETSNMQAALAKAVISRVRLLSLFQQSLSVDLVLGSLTRTPNKSTSPFSHLLPVRTEAKEPLSLLPANQTRAGPHSPPIHRSKVLPGSVLARSKDRKHLRQPTDGRVPPQRPRTCPNCDISLGGRAGKQIRSVA